MQIISGIYKHRSIKEPRNKYTHPMGSREKLALFNMISSYLPSSCVLDAFAGTGSLGLECLSRGAKKVVFLEKSPQNAKIIAENISVLGETTKEQTEIIVKSAETVVFPYKFDVIIADPPYDNFNIDIIAHLTPYLTDGGIFVLSHPHIKTPPILPRLSLISTHSYAAANISIYRSL